MPEAEEFVPAEGAGTARGLGDYQSVVMALRWLRLHEEPVTVWLK